MMPMSFDPVAFAPRNAPERIIEVLLAVVILLAPFAFGSVEYWAQALITLTAALMLALLLLDRIVHPSQPLTSSLALWPMAGFVGLVLLQLAPLPMNVIEMLSPRTAALWAEAGVVGQARLSLDPQASWRDLRLVFVMIAIFFVVLNVFRRTEDIKRVLAVVAVSGAAVGLFALYQNLAGTREIFGLPVGHPNSGPFLNRSHFSQYMNLAAGAMLALLLIHLTQNLRRGERTIRQVYFEPMDREHLIAWGLTAAFGLAALTVCLSMSRGGMLSLAVALGLVTLLLATRSGLGQQSILLLALGLGAFSVLLFFGFDAVYERVATLRHLEQASGGRFEILRDLSVAWAQFPIFGTGLGSHEHVFPLFDRSLIPGPATHAENEYAQLMLETGGIGMLMILAFLAIVIHRALPCLWRPVRSVHWGGFGLAVGLIAILIHSASDFGQHVPAIAILTAVSTALICRLHRHHQLDQHQELDDPEPRSPQTARFRRLAIAGPALAVMVWCVISVDASRRAEAASHQAFALETKLFTEDDPPIELYKSLIESAHEATRLQPNHPRYAQLLAEYRWLSLNRRTDPTTGRVLLSEAELEFTHQIVADLTAVRRLAPTYAPPVLLAGRITRGVLGDVEAGNALIRIGQRLSPQDPTAALYAGIFAGEAGDWDATMEHFNRAVAQAPNLHQEVIQYYVHEADRPDLAYRMLENKRDWLGRLAHVLGEDHPIAVLSEERSRTILLERHETGESSPNELVEIARLRQAEGNLTETIRLLRAALAQDYGRVQWRYELALALAEAGEHEEAHREAQLCLRMRPQMGQALALIDRLAVRVD